MEDIVPKLYESIEKYFEKKVKADKQIQRILENKGDISFSDLPECAKRIGGYAIDSLRTNIKREILPDDNFYWNIGKGTIEPIMKKVHALICELFVTIQTNEDAKQNIGLKPIRPQFNEERIEAVLNKITWISGANDRDDMKEVSNNGK